VQEIEKALAELQRLMEYRALHIGQAEEFLGIGLSSRKNLCIHPEVRLLCTSILVTMIDTRSAGNVVVTSSMLGV